MNTEKYDQYDQVVEVKKYVKKPWTTSCLDFSIKDENTYLVDSDNHKDEISWVNLDKFVEIEEGDATYRKYRVLK